MATPRGPRLSFDDSDMAYNMASELPHTAPSPMHSPTYSATSPTYSPNSPPLLFTGFADNARYVRRHRALNRSPTKLPLESEDEDVFEPPVKCAR